MQPHAIVAKPTQARRQLGEGQHYNPNPMHTILLAGADENRVRNLEAALAEAGHPQLRVRRRAELLDVLHGGSAQAVVIAGRLADGSFGDCLRAVRQAPGLGLTPCLVVGDGDDAIDRIVALELGADDFVNHDCTPRELLLRVRSLLRRTRASGPEPAGRERYGRIELDRQEYRIWVDEREVSISAADFQLLVALASPAGAVHRRQPLEALLIGTERAPGARWLDARVSRLRARLFEAGDQVETVRGVGFRLSVRPV